MMSYANSVQIGRSVIRLSEGDRNNVMQILIITLMQTSEETGKLIDAPINNFYIEQETILITV